jgi:hypothetical protein
VLPCRIFLRIKLIGRPENSPKLQELTLANTSACEILPE